MLNKIQNKKLYIFIFYTFFYLIIFYISWIVWILELTLSITIYLLIFYFFYTIWKKVRKQKNILSINDYIYYFLYRLSILIVIIITLLWSFAYYNNKIKPAPMPEITISNWKKTVIFQSMSHIWTSDFYETVKNNLHQRKNEWYVYFFEWVKWWTQENMEKFDKALWVVFDEELYENFSKLYWITNQDNSIFYWLVNDLDFNVDLNLDEIIEYYEKNIENTEESNNHLPETPINISKEVSEILIWVNEKQLKIIVYINQSILNFLIKSEKIQEVLTNNFSNKQLFDVILNKRNEVLSNEIINSEYDKIYITYWLLHFKWVLELLQEQDSNWKIIWERYFYPIQ